MAMTADVKDELSRVVVTKVSARKAEVSTILRFAGGLHIVGGRVIVEAELDTGAVARRVRKEIGDLYGHRRRRPGADRVRHSARAPATWCGWSNGGDSLARQTGLLDQRGRPVRGLPSQIVAGSVADAEAAWRGAFLAHGSLTEPGRSRVAGDHLPGAGGRAGAGRLGPPARHRGQGARGARCGPGGGPRR